MPERSFSVSTESRTTAMRCRRIASLGIAPLALLVTSCSTAYEPLPPAPHFTAGALAGEWRGPEGAHFSLSKAGEFTAVRLRGQEMDFDEHWSLSGKGTWEVLDSYKGGRTVADGKMVELIIKNGKSSAAKEGQEQLDGSNTASTGQKKAPTTYTWMVSVKKEGKNLRLYYVVGDPDARWLCQFTHA
ncbi:hypothetical protein SAMN05428945_5297 [Streptomyces sp. 2224.1]|nr:hypothetical protein SAMN05428945_5297 [Streptomyces sp. 2224.1]